MQGQSLHPPLLTSFPPQAVAAAYPPPPGSAAAAAAAAAAEGGGGASPQRGGSGSRARQRPRRRSGVSGLMRAMPWETHRRSRRASTPRGACPGPPSCRRARRAWEGRGGLGAHTPLPPPILERQVILDFQLRGHAEVRPSLPPAPHTRTHTAPPLPRFLARFRRAFRHVDPSGSGIVDRQGFMQARAGGRGRGAALTCPDPPPPRLPPSHRWPL